jgi:hypothetical protein
MKPLTETDGDGGLPFSGRRGGDAGHNHELPIRPILARFNGRHIDLGNQTPIRGPLGIFEAEGVGDLFNGAGFRHGYGSYR